MRGQLLILTTLGWLACSLAAFAEEAPPADSSASSSIFAPARATGTGSPVRRERLADGWWVDAFQGDGASRSYELSWRRIAAAGVKVILDGRTLAEGEEYTLDPAEGRLRLTRAPLSSATLRIAYRTRPYFSEARFPATAPTRLGLAERLSLGGRSTADTPGEARLPLPALYSATRGSREGSGPVFDHLATGLRLTDVHEQYGGGPAGSGTANYVRADAFDPAAAPGAREEVSTDLNLRPSPGSRFLFSNFLSRGSLFTDNYEEMERQRLQFDQTWGKSTAALMWEHRRSDGYGVANSLDAFSLAFSHPFSHSTSADAFFSDERSLALGRESRGLFTLRQMLGDAVEAQGSALYRTSSLSGNTFESALRLFARPTSGSDLSLTYAGSDSERFGKYQKVALDANGAIGKNVQLMGQFSQRYSDQLGNIQNLGLGLAARPTDRSLVEASVSESVGNKTGTATAQTLRYSLDPSSVFKLQVGYDGVQSTRDGSAQNALWLVEAGGRNYVKLEGYAGNHTDPTGIFYNDSLYRLEVRPAGALTLSGSLRQVLGPTEHNSLAGVGATVHLLRGLDVSAAYRRPTEVWASEATPQSGDVKLSLAPVSGFRVFGEYSVRPEDERGALLDQVHRSVGLETRLGSFSVQGSVTQVDGVLAPDAGRRLDVLASLGLGRGTRLFGGIRTQEGLFADQTRSQIYRFGISQMAGESFFLTLEGQLGWLENGAERTLDPDETRAQARLGLRF